MSAARFANRPLKSSWACADQGRRDSVKNSALARRTAPLAVEDVNAPFGNGPEVDAHAIFGCKVRS
jgi:hypothetical protein